MRSDFHVGAGAREHFELGIDFLWDLSYPLIYQLSGLRTGEEISLVRVTKLPVQVKDLTGDDINAGLAQDMLLDCDIRDVLVFLTRRRLHFDQVVALVEPLEYVDRHEGAVLEEACLEDAGGSLLQGGACVIYGPPQPSMIKVDRPAIREEFSGQSADPLSLVEEILQNDARLQFDSVGFVDLPPEEFVALDAGHESRL